MDPEYREKNREKLRADKARWYEENKERQKEKSSKNYYAKHEANKQKCREYHYKNLDAIREKNRRRAREKKLERRLYLAKNREAINKSASAYLRRRMKEDLNFKLRNNVRSRLARVVKGKIKTGSAIRDLGCTVDYLKTHLEANFAEGMTWQNYGKGIGKWNIDHIVPLSAFNLEDRQHFVLATHYLNLRPLWHEENMSKKDKLPWETLAPEITQWGLRMDGVITQGAFQELANLLVGQSFA